VPSPFRRMREHAGLFVALLGTAALVSGFASGIGGFLDQRADAGVRDGLADRAGTDLALRVSFSRDADAAAQDATVRALIARDFAALDAPVTVTRLATVPTTIDGEPVIAASIPDLTEHAELVAGAWPADAGAVAVQADAAEELGLAVGDLVALGDPAAPLALTVAATWRVSDPLDPRWLGDPLLVEGAGRTGIGPIVVADELIPRLAEEGARLAWTIVPETERMTAADLPLIPKIWNLLPRSWRGSIESMTSLQRQGRLLVTAEELVVRVDGLRAVQPVALLLLAGVAVVGFAELARLLTTVRAGETTLLWSRGASPPGLALRAGLETAAVTAVGAAVGTAVAATGLVVTAPLGAPGPLGPLLAVPAVASVVVATLVVTVATARDAARQSVEERASSGRGRRLAGTGVVVLLGGAAALAVQQLVSYGSPVIAGSVDPLAVVAPVLALLALVLAALVVFPVAARAAERRIRRGSITALLATRTLARRGALAAAPLVATATAVGALVIAAGYSGTWASSFDLTTSLRAGAALHVSADRPGLPAETVDRLSELPGVSALAPFDRQPLAIGSDEGELLAIAPDALAALAAPRAGDLDRAAVADALRVTLPGPVVPESTRRVELDVRTTLLAEPPTLTIRAVDALGVERALPFDPAIDDGVDPGDPGAHRYRYVASIPDDLAGPLRVLALDADLSDAAVTGLDIGRLALLALSADGSPLPLDGSWITESPDPRLGFPTPLESGIGFATENDTRFVRLTPSFGDAFTDDARPPIVISQALADLTGLGVGDRITFSLELAPDRVTGLIAAIVPVVPSAATAPALLIDLGVVQHYALRSSIEPSSPGDVWIATDDAASVASAARDLLPPNARLDAASDPASRTVLAAAASALQYAALGAGVLAVVAVVASAGAQARGRRSDVAVLRALGVRGREQAAIRRRELLIVLAVGAVVGLLAGATVIALTVPALVTAAIPRPYPGLPMPLAADPVVLVVGGTALAIALALVVLAAGRAVARDARAAPRTEEST
jgi:hypothetical protein